MNKITKKDIKINKIEEEFIKNAYIDPNYEYIPKYKYKSFYLQEDGGFYRCGVDKLKLSLKKVILGNEISYNRKIQTIDLRLYSEKAGFFKVENINFHVGKNYTNKYDPIIYYKEKGQASFKIVEYGYKYEKKEFEDILVIFTREINSEGNNQFYNLYINLNGEIINKIKNISTYNYLSNIPNKLIYGIKKKQKKKKYKFYAFDYNDGSKEYLGEQEDINLYDEMIYTSHLSSNINNEKMNTNSQISKVLEKIEKYIIEEIYDGKYVYFYFSDDRTPATMVLLELFGCSKELIKENFSISKRKSNNYKAWVKKDNMDDILFVLYVIIKYNVPRFKLFGYEVKNLMKFITNGSKIYDYYINNEEPENYKIARSIINFLKRHKDVDDEGLIKLLVKHFGIYSTRLIDTKYNPYMKLKDIDIIHPMNLKNKKKKEFDKRFQQNYQQALLKNENNVRWKSEFQLFKLINSYYEDAIYQFRDDWINPQSIDIFIPSKKIAIEYQGIQHYEAIEFFGGEKGLKNNKKRDREKGKKCKKNNIRLIQWKYDEPINDFILINKLKSISENLDINLALMDVI